MTLVTRRRRNTIIAVVSAVGLFGTHQAYDAALYDSALLSGWILFISMLLLTLFNLRKKLTMLPIGSSATWLQIHVYLGWIAVVLFALHIGWRVPSGFIEVTLAILFVAVAGTGILGIILSRTLPRRLTRRGEEVILERVPAFLAEIRQETEQVVIQSTTDANSNTIRDFYAEHLHSFFMKPKNFFQHLFGSNRRLFTLLAEFDNTDRILNARERELVGELRLLVVKKDELDFHYALQTTLKSWLLIHIPATFALLIFAVLHLVVVLAFGGGIG
jgi:hypothetical protein